MHIHMRIYMHFPLCILTLQALFLRDQEMTEFIERFPSLREKEVRALAMCFAALALDNTLG